MGIEEQLATIHFELLHHHLEGLGGRHCRLLGVFCMREDQAEVSKGKSSNRIGLQNTTRQPFGQHLHQPIADLCAQRVGDDNPIVDTRHKHSDRRTVLIGVKDSLAKAIHE